MTRRLRSLASGAGALVRPVRLPLVCLLGCPGAFLPAFEEEGLLPWPVAGPAALPRMLERSRAPLVLVGTEADLSEAVAICRADAPGTGVLAWLPDGDGASVREALRAGADEVLLEPAPAQVAARLVALLGDQEVAAEGFAGLVGHSAGFLETLTTCAQVAPSAATVLLLGETGTGKELLARAIHDRSGRAGRFVAINCGAVPETLVESELFGHVKGSFTGASHDRPGLFRHAHGGTLFLDEVGSLPSASQFSLLRALQEGRIRPVGGIDEVPVDVRILAATSEPLERAVEEGRFRADLFYRLDVIRIVVPPLRERPEDVPRLFEHFLEEHARYHRRAAPVPTTSLLEALRAHAWPGNVRELKNLAERLVLTRPGARLEARHLEGLLGGPRCAGSQVGSPLPPTPSESLLEVEVDLSRTLQDFLQPQLAGLERRYLEAALRLNEGAMQSTANTAGISRRTLLRKLRELGLDRTDFTPLRGAPRQSR